MCSPCDLRVVALPTASSEAGRQACGDRQNASCGCSLLLSFFCRACSCVCACVCRIPSSPSLPLQMVVVGMSPAAMTALSNAFSHSHVVHGRTIHAHAFNDLQKVLYPILVSETDLFEPFVCIYKRSFVPRQARDKHREGTQKMDYRFSLRLSALRASSSACSATSRCVERAECRRSRRASSRWSKVEAAEGAGVVRMGRSRSQGVGRRRDEREGASLRSGR